MKKESKYNVYEKAVILGISSIVGMITLVVAVLLAASVCLALDISNEMSSGISGVCIGVGGLVSGFVAAKKLGCGGVINGALCGIIIYALIVLISLFLSESGFTLNTVYHLAVILIASALGGFLGVNTSDRHKIL